MAINDLVASVGNGVRAVGMYLGISAAACGGDPVIEGGGNGGVSGGNKYSCEAVMNTTINRCFQGNTIQLDERSVSKGEYVGEMVSYCNARIKGNTAWMDCMYKRTEGECTPESFAEVVGDICDDFL